MRPNIADIRQFPVLLKSAVKIDRRALDSVELSCYSYQHTKWTQNILNVDAIACRQWPLAFASERADLKSAQCLDLLRLLLDTRELKSQEEPEYATSLGVELSFRSA